MILLKLSPPAAYKEIQLSIGQPIEEIDCNDITSLYADGDEYKWVKDFIENVPYSRIANSCTWFGDTAKTIAALYIQKHKK